MLKPREPIARLGEYESPIVTRQGLSLDLNESMAGCSPRVLARLHSLKAEDVSLYPQRETGERLVAGFLGLDPGRVLLTNGLDETLSLLFNAYLGPGDQLLFADPTFVMYPMLGEVQGAEVIRIPSGESLELPVAAMLAAITPRTRLIAIANPNNPTGLVARREDLLRIAAAAPDAAVIVDEAYCEFCGETVLADLERYPNLFVGRTFSKVYGMAGLRLGVLAGAEEQIRVLRRLSLPFNINSVVLACLEAALADQAFIRQHVAQIEEGRLRLLSLLNELGLRTWPSQTSFVLTKVGDSSAKFVEAMLRRGIVVRDSSGAPGCRGCVRITVGTPEQMDRVLPAIRESVREARD